ncbi:MAG: hypothetical protein ABF289_05395 [Clostridiales bacterium]
MIKKFFLLSIVALQIIIYSTSCSNIKSSPGDTVKAPEYSHKNNNSAKILENYRELINKNAAPNKIIKFLDENIGNLSKDAVDNIVGDSLFSVLEKQQKNYEDKLFDNKFSEKIAECKIETLQNVNEIEDQEVKLFVENILKDGYKIYMAEGMYNLEIDYELFNKKFASYCSEELSEYLVIMEAESIFHSYEDGGVIISWDDIAERIVTAEKYLNKYPDGKFYNNIKQIHSKFLSTYLLGTDNLPAFNYSDNEVNSGLLTSYKKTLIKYNETSLADIINEYKYLIEISKYKKTAKIVNYATEVSDFKNSIK